MPTRSTPRTQKRLTFILRIWPHGRDEQAWVGEIQEVATGETVHVPNLKVLFDWLTRKTIPGPDPGPSPNGRDLPLSTPLTPLLSPKKGEKGGK